MNPKTLTQVVTVTILAYMLVTKANAQIINTPCTASMIATFTPCMNYITGSTANGTSSSSSPSSNCCYAFKSLMGSSMDCACLLLTAGIPLQLGAFGLSRFCKGVNVPVQCQASGSPLAAPGPLQFAAPPPSSAFSPQGASKATAATPIADQPTPPPPEQPPADAPQVQLAAPPTTPGVWPVLVAPPPSSPSIINMPTIWLILLGFISFNL